MLTISYVVLDSTLMLRRYEAEGRARRTVKAHDLWMAICVAQIETGTPYMVYKDACNLKSNQKNLGTIRSSNLCTGMCVSWRQRVYLIKTSLRTFPPR